MKKIEVFGIAGAVGLIANTLFVSDAYAYIDPGSGSLIIQVIIGALVGAGITIKVYWYKFKEKILGISKKEK